LCVGISHDISGHVAVVALATVAACPDMSCDIPAHKTTSPKERTFTRYIHLYHLAAEM